MTPIKSTECNKSFLPFDKNSRRSVAVTNIYLSLSILFTRCFFFIRLVFLSSSLFLSLCVCVSSLLFRSLIYGKTFSSRSSRIECLLIIIIIKNCVNWKSHLIKQTRLLRATQAIKKLTWMFNDGFDWRVLQWIHKRNLCALRIACRSTFVAIDWMFFQLRKIQKNNNNNNINKL